MEDTLPSTQEKLRLKEKSEKANQICHILVFNVRKIIHIIGTEYNNGE